MIDCALFEPDIPQNAGTIIRLGACFGVPIHIVHPAGFALSDKDFRRAGMDYLSRAQIIEHAEWSSFQAWRTGTGRRLIALSSRGSKRLPDYSFQRDDVLLLGRESAGLPEPVLHSADAVLRIPIAKGSRSLNVAVAAAIALFAALERTRQLPQD